MLTTWEFVRQNLARVRRSEDPVRDLVGTARRALTLLTRGPDGLLFRLFCLRNSPVATSTDRSLAFAVQSRVRDLFRLPFIVNYSKIEIELTTLCNLTCNNCDRSSGQAKSSEAMTVEQIAKFLDESVKHGKRWRKIVIQGGEPLLHPQILQILDMFVEYKRSFSPGTFVRVTTNGWGAKVQKVLEQMPKEIFVVNTRKIPLDDQGHIKITGRPEPVFDTYHYAPVDVPDIAGRRIDFRSGCNITEDCGLGLTRYGYFPCGAGASVARVFGLDVGVKSLAEISTKRFRETLDQLCRRCGHFKTCSRYTFPDTAPKQSEDQITSVTWHGALKTFAEKKDGLSVY